MAMHASFCQTTRLICERVTSIRIAGSSVPHMFNFGFFRLLGLIGLLGLFGFFELLGLSGLFGLLRLFELFLDCWGSVGNVLRSPVRKRNVCA